MKVWKMEVFYAARWTGDVESVLAELRTGLKARYGWVRDTDGSERRSFAAEVQGETLVVTMGLYELGPGYSRGFPIGDETCTIEPGHWIVFDNSDDQGDYLWSMNDAAFRKQFKEIVKLSNTETLIACVLGVAIGVAIAEAVLALVVALAALLVIFTIARGTMRVRWTRRGARTAVEIRDGHVTIHTTKEKIS